MESSIPWLLFALLLSVLFLLPKSFIKGIFSRGHRLPPGPKPLPIVGNLLELGDQPHRSLARLADVYGPIMTLRLGQVNTIVISSPDMAREVLQTHDAVFANRSIPEAVRVLSHTDASLVWLPPSQRWRNLRKICNTQLFTPQKLDAHRSIRQEKVRELTQFISDSASKGLPVEIGRVAFTTVLNLLSRTIFSVDLADLYEESSQKFKHVVQGILEEAGKPNLSDYFPLLAWIDPQGIRRRSRGYFKQLRDEFDEQIDRRIRSYKHEETKAGCNDFLDELLYYQVQEDGSKFDRPAMRSLLTDIFGAGSDTTSATVEWAMAELLRSPPAMARVREEIVRVIGLDRDVDESDINALPYLQAVVKETLRLHPPVPLMVPHDGDDRGAERRLRDTEGHAGAHQRLGHRAPPRSVGRCGDFLAGELFDDGGGLQEAGLRADTVRGGAKGMPRLAAGVPYGAPHAGVAAAEVRVEATGRDGGEGCGLGGEVWVDRGHGVAAESCCGSGFTRLDERIGATCII